MPTRRAKKRSFILGCDILHTVNYSRQENSKEYFFLTNPALKMRDCTRRSWRKEKRFITLLNDAARKALFFPDFFFSKDL